MPQTDVVLGERYRLDRRIAGGGMGEVWHAADEVLGREVAVKILRREYADDATFLARFQNEARHTAGLSHPGIAAVYDYGEEDGSPYLVMEYVPGEPLADLISREGALAPDRVLDVVGQTALALQAAHAAGVIHRDVKPGNLLVTPEGRVKVTDFGIARATGAVPLTQTGAIMGTAYYISPEQASGGSVTPASDLYSLGVVAYECLAGRKPFAGDTPVSVALAQVRDEPPALPAGVPAPVAALVMRLLAKDPAQRPETAGSLGEEALALRASGTVAGVPAASAGPDPTAVLTVGDDAGTVPPEPGPRPTRLGSATDPGFRLPEPSRRRGWVGYLVVGLVLALVVVLLAQACSRAATDSTDTADPGGDQQASSDPTASEPATVTVVEDALVGRRATEVREELVGKGLRVAQTGTASGGTVGTVDAVSPTGEVRLGSTVTLTVVRASSGGAGSDDGGGKDDDKGKGKGRVKGDGEGDD